jgi:hypothetical protein
MTLSISDVAGFSKLPRALLLRLKEPHVFDRNHSLVGEGFDQFDLLFREWPNHRPL